MNERNEGQPNEGQPNGEQRNKGRQGRCDGDRTAASGRAAGGQRRRKDAHGHHLEIMIAFEPGRKGRSPGLDGDLPDVDALHVFELLQRGRPSVLSF